MADMNRLSLLLLLPLITLLPLAAQDDLPVPGQLSGPIAEGVYDITGSGNAMYAVADNNVLRSLDNGESWERITTPPGRLSEIEVSADGDLWVISDLGLYRLSEGSGEWSRAREGDHVSLAVTADGSLFVIDRALDQLTRSTDGGDTWEPLAPSGENFRQVVPADGQTIWALSDAGGEVSLDNGTTWTSHGLVPAPSGRLHLLPLESGEVLLITAEKIYRTSAGESGWDEFGDAPDSRPVSAAVELPDGGVLLGYESDQASTPSLYSLIVSTNEWELARVSDQYEADLTPRALIVAEGERLLMGTSYTDRQWGEPGIDIGQIMLSDDLGESWDVAYSTSFSGSYILKAAVLSEQTIVAVRYPPAFPQEEGHLIYRTDNGGRDWQEITPGGDVRYSTYSILSDGTLYMTRGDTALYRSVDTGRSWAPLPSPPTSWVPAGEVIEIDPQNLLVESRVGLGEAKVFASTDGGDTWSLRGERESAGAVDWAIDPTGVIYIAVNTGVSVSFDSGATWTTASLQSGPGNYLTGITISGEGKPVVATFLRKLYTSNNSGTTWTELAGSPGNQLSEIVTDSRGNLYVGSRSGTIYRSGDNGETWGPFTAIPAPSTAIRSLSIGPEDYLYISTELRGVWRVSTTGASDVPTLRRPAALNLR